MKFIRSPGFMLLVAGSVFGAEPSIELRGVMVGGGATKLSLADEASETTRWVEVGQTFMGFAVKAYDPAKETATFTKDGKEFRIRLNVPKIIEAAPAAVTVASASAANTGKLSTENARLIFNNLRQIAAAADQFYLENQRETVTLDELVGPTKYIKELKPVAGEDYSVLKLSRGTPSFTVTTPSRERVSFDQGGYMSSFYQVQPGDTLAAIASKTRSSPAQLAIWNDITDPAAIKAGQSLRTK